MKRIIGVGLLIVASITVSNAIYGGDRGSAHAFERDFRVVVDRDGLDLEMEELQAALEELNVELDGMDIQIDGLEDLQALNLDEEIVARIESRVRHAERRMARAARNASEEASSGSQETERFTWSGSMDAGQRLVVRGVNGPVIAEAWDGDEVQIEAIKSGRKQDPSTVNIEVVEHSGGVTVCAVYPGRGNECAADGRGEMNVKKNDVKVEFRVRVPAGVDFEGRTVNGDVEALGIDGNASAFTVNGDIEMEASGWAEGSTVNGGIRAAMGQPDAMDRLKFSTVNGSITLEVPENVNLDLEAEWLSGGIESALPIEMLGRGWQRSARAQFGTGGPDLEVSTINGSIKLLTRG